MQGFTGSSPLLSWKSVGINSYGFTKERTIERASSCYWTEPPLPEAFHRVSRAAGHLERQVARPQIFPVGPGLRETAEQREPEAERSESPASGDTPEEGLCRRGPSRFLEMMSGGARQFPK